MGRYVDAQYRKYKSVFYMGHSYLVILLQIKRPPAACCKFNKASCMKHKGKSQRHRGRRKIKPQIYNFDIWWVVLKIPKDFFLPLSLLW